MKKIKTFKIVSYDTGLLERLKNPEYAVIYLNTLLHDKDKGVQQRLLDALNLVAKAHGISAVARDTKLQRESLRKALSEKGNPRLSTLLAVIRSFGLELKFGCKGDSQPKVKKTQIEKHTSSEPATRADIRKLEDKIEQITKTAEPHIDINPQSPKINNAPYPRGFPLAAGVTMSGAGDYAR